ncbi:MAG: PH domain-containing protein [Micropruina sp.]|nr:MAG: PH domain-containing protein [Micropruina sp.]
MDDLFAPPGEHWQRLSPGYARVRRIAAAITLLVVFLPAAGLTWWFTGQWLWGAAVAAAGVALIVFQWWRVGRWVRAWGYAERAEDLYLSHGLWFRQLTVIPYGRMQLVKVESGPIERSLGLATVQLVTASPQTDARIPGLPADEAARLRDRLVEAGQADQAGL